jgi:hypothetical protein
MPRLKQRRQNIQYGGTKVSIRESIEAQFRPSFNNDEISLALLENCTSIDLINSNSYGSYIFTGTIPKDDSLVMIESQVEKKIYTLNPNMSFENAKHTSYNVGRGKQYTKFVMKVIFCDYDNNDAYHTILCDSSRKEVSSKEYAKSEFDIQQRVYAESICNSGETGTIIPDAISYTIIDINKFTKLFKKGLHDGLIDEIARVSKEKKLKLFIIFIDFLDGFTTFGSLIRTLDISLHRTISYKVSSIMLYILFNSKILNGDLHEDNIMCKITKRQIFADIVDIKLIDLGKTFDIAKALTIFQNYIDSKEFKLQELMCKFFRIEYSQDQVNIRENLVQQFKLNYDELLGDLDNLKKKFIEGTNKIYKREIIFKMLVFICFIDAMVTGHKHYGQIQFKYVVMYVFNCDKIIFNSLHNFLLLFSLDYSTYLQNINHDDYSEHKLNYVALVTTKKFNDTCDMGLDVICDNLVEMLSVCKRWKGATPLLLRGNDQIEEARFLISTDSKDTSRWENFINRGGSARKRKYRSRRLSKHSKSIKHRRYHYRHFTKRNLIK